VDTGYKKRKTVPDFGKPNCKQAGLFSEHKGTASQSVLG